MASKAVLKPKENALTSLFGAGKALIGVVHARPLPGSPSYAGKPVTDIYAHAVAEARRYADGGFDGIIVENHGDIPFAKPDEIGPETVAVMTLIADRVREAVGLPVGINILANAAIPAFAAAKAAGAAFVRLNQWANAYVANEGIIEGPAAKATRYRAWLRANDVRVFADVHVKHGAHAIVADRPVAELARDAEFFDADVLIATGQRTGGATSPDEARLIKEATPLPVVIGSGVTMDNVAELLSVADGVIIASALKHDGVWWNEVDPERVATFVGHVRALR